MTGSPCSCHFSPQRPLFPPGPPSLCPEPHPFSPPLHPPLQLKAWLWVRRLPQLYNSTETQAKFPPHFHGCKSKAASWTSTVQKPDQHLAPQLLSTSKSVERRAGRHSVTAARGCLFPPAKANSSSDTVPGRPRCGTRPWHTATATGENPEGKEDTEHTHAAEPSSSWREFKEGWREGSGGWQSYTCSLAEQGAMVLTCHGLHASLCRDVVPRYSLTPLCAWSWKLPTQQGQRQSRLVRESFEGDGPVLC